MGGGGRWILFSSISIFCFRPSLSAHPQILLDGGGGQGWEREARRDICSVLFLLLAQSYSSFALGMRKLGCQDSSTHSLNSILWHWVSFLAGNKTGKTIQSFPLIVFSFIMWPLQEKCLNNIAKQASHRPRCSHKKSELRWR